jgi:S1-C subfamily serine protease
MQREHGSVCACSGNSGGPLLDSAGRIIGVNTAIFTASGTSAGVGFAIGIDTVRKVVPQLILSGRVIRPALNIQVRSAAPK